MDEDFESPVVPKLAAGFTALSEEYKELANRYTQLEVKLEEAKKQVSYAGVTRSPLFPLPFS